MTDAERKALVQRLREIERLVTIRAAGQAADQIEADGQRIAELEAENERLRYHLGGALDTLQDAEVCSEDCVPCAEARAALGDKQ